MPIRVGPNFSPATTKKAPPCGGALQPQSTMRTAPQAPPALEGIPFDWTARFRDSHHGKAEAFDWQTGCTEEYSVRASAGLSSRPAIASGVEIVALVTEAASIVAAPSWAEKSAVSARRIYRPRWYSPPKLHQKPRNVGPGCRVNVDGVQGLLAGLQALGETQGAPLAVMARSPPMCRPEPGGRP